MLFPTYYINTNEINFLSYNFNPLKNLSYFLKLSTLGLKRDNTFNRIIIQ